MSASSKNSSPNAEPQLNRPFDRDTWTRAETIASRYRLLLESEDGRYYGSAVEMPYVMADGKTANACVKATREALTAAVATLIEQDRTPPEPASGEKRSEQVNVRLTRLEKLRLEDNARKRGFRGLSDYIRNRALDTD